MAVDNLRRPTRGFGSDSGHESAMAWQVRYPTSAGVFTSRSGTREFLSGGCPRARGICCPRPVPAPPLATVVLAGIVAWPLACGVPAPGGAGVDVLAGGGGVVEAEGVGDDGGGDLQDELAQRRDAGGAQGQAVVAELGGDGAVGGGLAGMAAGEQPAAGVVGGDVVVAAGGELVQQRAERRRDGLGGSPSRSQVWPSSSRDRSAADSRRMRLSGWAYSSIRRRRRGS